MRQKNLIFLALPASMLGTPYCLEAIAKACFSKSGPQSGVQDLELDAFGVPQLDATKLADLVDNFSFFVNSECCQFPKMLISGFADPDARTELKMASMQRKSNGFVKFDTDGAHSLHFQLEFEQIRLPPEVQLPLGKFMTKRFDRAFSVC